MSPKFRSKADWIVESDFMGQKNKKVLYKKGHIFEADTNGMYTVVDPYGNSVLVNEETMRDYKMDCESDEDFFEIVKEEFEIIIEEIPEDDDNLVRNWRIQLDVKTTRKKLKEVQQLIEEHIRPIL
jgi:hypothetical protein